jgi:hypothetical protein
MSPDITVACNYLSDTCIVWTRAMETRLASCVVHLFGSCQMTGWFVGVGVRGNVVVGVLILTDRSLQLTLAVVCAVGS